MKQEVEVGDWVAFQSGGRVVYAKVEYVKPRNSWERSCRLVTTNGEVHADMVLEAR